MPGEARAAGACVGWMNAPRARAEPQERLTDGAFQGHSALQSATSEMHQDRCLLVLLLSGRVGAPPKPAQTSLLLPTEPVPTCSRAITTVSHGLARALTMLTGIDRTMVTPSPRVNAPSRGFSATISRTTSPRRRAGSSAGCAWQVRVRVSFSLPVLFLRKETRQRSAAVRSTATRSSNALRTGL
jgi:hypothetical protein